MTTYRRSAVVLAVLLVLACALALAVDDDGWDSALGAVAGASAVLLLGCLLGIVLERRRQAREVDTASLDGLEPLRAARRDA